MVSFGDHIYFSYIMPYILIKGKMRDFEKWIKLRENSIDEFGEKLCYCGHTNKCSCSNPDLNLFNESLKNRTIILNDKNNGWIKK